MRHRYSMYCQVKYLFRYFNFTFRFRVHEHQWQFHGDITVEGGKNNQLE